MHRRARIIHIEPGTYVGAFVATASGTSTAPISLCGAPGTILSGTSTATNYVLHLDGANWWQLYGFATQTAQKGVVLDSSNNNTLADLTVSNIGDEGIHFRDFSSSNTLIGSTIFNTGNLDPKFGEGVYVGSANSNWCSITNCNPDTSNNNQILNNSISATTAENIDIKEGTTGGLISGNTFSGTGIHSADASAWVNLQGQRVDRHQQQRKQQP